MFEAFLTIMLVANVLPILPVTLELTSGHDPSTQRKLLLEATFVGSACAMGVAIAGGALLRATRLTADDLRAAGGLVLLVFAVYDLLFNRERRKRPIGELLQEPHESSLVPLAVPLLVGPAVLTTVLVVAEDAGKLAALVAIGANALLNAVIFTVAQPIHAKLGGGLGRAVGKVMSLVLATIAVSMIRTGIGGMIRAGL